MIRHEALTTLCMIAGAVLVWQGAQVAVHGGRVGDPWTIVGGIAMGLLGVAALLLMLEDTP